MTQRARRLPFTALDSIPLDFSYNVDPATRRITLTIEAPEDFADILMDGLGVLTQLAQRTSFFVKAAERDMRTTETLKAHEKKTLVVRRTYWTLRDKGLRYRAAVHALVNDRSLPFYGQWKFFDYASCVKYTARPAPQLTSIAQRR